MGRPLAKSPLFYGGKVAILELLKPYKEHIASYGSFSFPLGGSASSVHDFFSFGSISAMGRSASHVFSSAMNHTPSENSVFAVRGNWN